MLKGQFSQINVIPFIDIMLVLLVIVLMSATFIVRGEIPLDLPKAQSAQDATEAKELTIAINKEGRIYLNEEPIGFSALAKRLSELPKERAISLKADSSSSFGEFVRVIEEIKKHGLEKLTILTLKE